MISRRTSSIRKEDVIPKLLYSDSRSSQACCQHSQVLPNLLFALQCTLLALPDLLSALQDLMSAHPDFLLVLQGASGLVIGDARLVVPAPDLAAGVPRCSQVHPKFPSSHRGVPKPFTITPMALLYLSSEIPVTPKAGHNAHLGSNTLLKLIHLSLHSTSSQTLLVTSSD
jgi:hypothetical protein